MRAQDQPIPTVTGPRPPADRDIPHRLHIAIERVVVDQYVWDDFTATWDDPGDRFVWHHPVGVTGDRVDATCWFEGLDIVYPESDAESVFPAASLALTLDNHTGIWSAYDEYGRLVDYLPGRRLEVWADDGGEPWWLFSGEITSWAETAGGMVDVEAFSTFSRLQQQIGTWTPGSPGQYPAARLQSICDLIGYTGPRRFDLGDVTLLAPPTERTPLEEMQQVAISDGGVLATDADGTLLYRDRAWTGGRADQTSIPIVSDNVCTADAVLWDLELVTDDLFMVNLAVLTNAAEPPVTVTATNPDSETVYGRMTLPDPRDDDLWTTALEGQRLADYLTTRRADARLRVGQISAYLHDPRQDLWRLGLDRAAGDILEVLHEQPAAGGTALLDVYVVLSGIEHHITPSSWVTTWATTRTISNRVTNGGMKPRTRGMTRNRPTCGGTDVTVQIGSLTNVPGPGDPIRSPWTQDVTRRAVHIFASQATLNAQYGTAIDGSTAWTTDAGILWVRAGGAWRPLAWRQMLAGGNPGPLTTDAGGGFSFTHGLGLLPNWSALTPSGDSTAERVGHFSILGMSTTIISVRAWRTDTNTALQSSAIGIAWAAGRTEPSASPRATAEPPAGLPIYDGQTGELLQAGDNP